MASKVTLEQLVQGIQFKDPRLYDVLRGIISELRKLSKDVISLSTAELPTGLDVFPDVVTIFTYVIRPRSIHFEWVSVSGVVQYELRKGSDWDSADRILITSSIAADIVPIEAGTHTYLLKSIDANGIYSVDAASVDVIVHVPEGVTITTQIIDNNVLLRWTNSISDFEISYYEVKRDTTVIGNVTGTFTAVFESQAGSYVYSVTPVDIAGNVGVTNSVTAEVSQPPDYELTALFESDLSGTRTNVALVEGPKLICCVDITETWEDHFVNNTWDSPQEQVDAGYPWYPQPIPASGTYEETKDFGAIYSNVIVNLDWDFLNIVGTVAISASIEVSDDDITYSAPQTGVSLFFESVRYVRVTFTFTPADDTSFIEFFNLRFVLDVKREMDSGSVSALAADTSGTPVTFAKSFKDIDSITVAPLSTAFLIATYDFVDVPNPTGFSVYVWNSVGARANALVSWKARGVV